MNIIVKWHNQEQTIIRITLNQGWTWQEVYKLDAQIDAMLNSVAHKVSYIVDVSKGHKYSANYSQSRVQETLCLKHPNSDQVVLVGSTIFLRLLLTNIFRAMQAASIITQIADTIEEAEVLLSDITPHTDFPQRLNPSRQTDGLC